MPSSFNRSTFLTTSTITTTTITMHHNFYHRYQKPQRHQQITTHARMSKQICSLPSIALSFSPPPPPPPPPLGLLPPTSTETTALPADYYLHNDVEAVGSQAQLIQSLDISDSELEVGFIVAPQLGVKLGLLLGRLNLNQTTLMSTYSVSSSCYAIQLTRVVGTARKRKRKERKKEKKTKKRTTTTTEE